MSEHVKTALLILFIIGVIGAFNSIITTSQKNSENPLVSVTRMLGLTKKSDPIPGRSLDYVPGEISRPISQPQTSSSQNQASSPNEPTPQPTPIQPLQISPELPPLPPINNTLGVSTSVQSKLPPVPPLKKEGQTKGVKTQNDLQNQIKSVLNYFGF